MTALSSVNLTAAWNERPSDLCVAPNPRISEVSKETDERRGLWGRWIASLRGEHP